MLRVMRDEVPRTRDSKSYYVVQVVVEATHIWLVILVQSGVHYNFFFLGELCITAALHKKYWDAVLRAGCVRS